MTNQPNNLPTNGFENAENSPLNGGVAGSPAEKEATAKEAAENGALENGALENGALEREPAESPAEAHIYRAPRPERQQPQKSKKAKKQSRWKALKKWQRILIITVSVLLCLVLVFGAAFAILVQKGRAALFHGYGSVKMQTASNASDSTAQDGKTVTYNGKKYIFNEDVTSVLFMGVDKTNLNKTGTVGKNGQADAIFILAVDTKTGKTTIIPVVRDTMADVDVYSADGNYIASKKEQVCLAFAYGDGGRLSCENTVKAVSRLYYGLPINSYATIDLNALEILTAKVGGVELQALETLKMSQRTVTQGQQITLKGKDAVDYIQMRNKETVDSSLQRLKRQQQFIMAFSSKVVAATKKDITVPVKMYQAASGYMVTNIDLAKVSYFASLVVGGTDFSVNMQKIAGKMQMGAEYAEYYMDETAAYQTILDVFYKVQPN